jgi:hypothetical protein
VRVSRNGFYTDTADRESLPRNLPDGVDGRESRYLSKAGVSRIGGDSGGGIESRYLSGIKRIAPLLPIFFFINILRGRGAQPFPPPPENATIGA